MRCALRAAPALLLLAGPAAGHGSLNWPPARQRGSLAQGGRCGAGQCLWFSQISEIPGEPTVNEEPLRTYNVKVSAGPRDWSRKMPWRAPGTSPVIGSGCGSAGGGPKFINNGGFPPDGVKQGADGLSLPQLAGEPTVWKRGSEQEVAWGINANHGGGYSYRLCPLSSNVTEECFQRTVLRFAGDKQWLQHADLWQWGNVTHLPRVEVPLTKVSRGTHPEGSEWARNPVPGCLLCNQADCKGTFEDIAECGTKCAGGNLSTCPPGLTQFPSPADGVSGYFGGPWDLDGSYRGGVKGWIPGLPWNIIDRVIVPRHIPTGQYLLSWRWDCEQSKQVWQNCADITIQ
eukprot:TRINITY_DN402_c0_g1_i2.p1 TRINITY_DN402_c0_g1~~TRINITY_DN402_c0_g1_i2.p1  ORF type:complete len:344 (+),score=106.75 TRINITY_DN402_c0_g1_i2:86-1117(+)